MLSALFVALGSALWATDALFRHPLVQQLSPFTIVYFEHIFATLLAFLVLIFSHDRKHFLPEPKEFFASAFVGICGSAIATILFTASFQLINPSIAILLQKVQPIFVILISFLFLGEKFKPIFFGWAALALVSAYFMSFPEGLHLSDLHSSETLGCALAFLAAVLWAVSTTAGKLVLNKNTPNVLIFWRFAFGFFALFLISRKLDIMRIEIPFVPGQPGALKSLFIMAAIPGFLGVRLYYAGLKKVPASAATILELSFPVCAIAVNAYFLNFHLSTFQLLAAAVLILSMVGVSRTSIANP